MATGGSGDVPGETRSAGPYAGGLPSGTAVVGDVPRTPPAFQAREDLMTRLRSHGPGVCVVAGPRGTGKTQLAAAYGRECAGAGWRLVAWIDAQDTASLLDGLAAVADRLGLGSPGTSLEAVGVRVRDHVETDGDRCLLVFDNVTDLDDVRPYLPSAGASQVIVTSSEGGSPAIGTPVPVTAFTREESLDFLAERTGLAGTAQAAALAEEFGYLPLVLAQAPAVIKASGLGYDTYLTRLRGYPGQLFPSAASGRYPRLAAESVLLSIDAVTVADGTGLCADLLGVICLLSPAGVRRGLLRRGASGDVFASSAETVDEALASLAEAALLTFRGDESDPVVTAHPLIMGVTGELSAFDGTLTALGAKASALLAAGAEALGEPRDHRGAARDLVRQVLALTRSLARLAPEGTGPLSAALLTSRGWALRCVNRLGEDAGLAIELGEALVADQARELGADHQDTVKSRDSLAVAYWAARRRGEAVTLLEQALADQVRLFGDDHPDTLTTRNNLASAYWVAGRLTEAVPMFEQALAGFERLLGPDHPDVEVIRENLAVAREDAAQPGVSPSRLTQWLRHAFRRPDRR